MKVDEYWEELHCSRYEAEQMQEEAEDEWAGPIWHATFCHLRRSMVAAESSSMPVKDPIFERLVALVSLPSMVLLQLVGKYPSVELVPIVAMLEAFVEPIHPTESGLVQ